MHLLIASRRVMTLALLGSTLFAADSPAPSEPVKSLALPDTKDKIRWKPLLYQSLFFLGIEHGFRLATQDYTRHYLKGKFFEDYGAALGNLHGWGDGDSFLINYVGHPMQGAVAGYLFVANDPRYQKAEFGRNRDYWMSRARATVYSFAFSTQFELGPLSEASIGNTSKYFPQQGLVDHVISPSVGLLWMVAEDFLDRQLIERIEARTDKRWVKIMARGGLNPSRSFANAMRLEVPWHRDTRSDRLDEPTVLVGNRGSLHTVPQGFSFAERLPLEAEPIAPVNPAPPALSLISAVPTWELATTYSYSQLALGKSGSLSCNGGGGTVTYNVTDWLGIAAEVSGCKMVEPGVNVTGDSLTYMLGPRIAFRTGAWVPYLQLLAGGDKLATETMYPDRKPPEKTQPTEFALPILHSSYTSADQTNSFGIKYGGGLDRTVNRALAIRILSVENTHLWARLLNDRHYPNNLSVTTGVVLRFGTW